MAKAFFDEPRTWSQVKYKILIYYFREYFQKVNNFYHRPAVVADLFAGTGKFASGQDGSPLILSHYAREAYHATKQKNIICVAEAIRRNRQLLEDNLREYLRDGTAVMLPGDAREAGEVLLRGLSRDKPFVIFLDPFGLKGLSMELMRQIFERVDGQSTEVLLNYNEPSLYRHFGRIRKDQFSRDAVRSKDILRYCIGASDDIDKIIAGLAEGTLEFQDAVKRFTNVYLAAFRKHFRYVEIFPITEAFRSQRVKYYLLFATRSKIAFELMSDCMARTTLELGEEYNRRWQENSIFGTEHGDEALIVPDRRTPIDRIVYSMYHRVVHPVEGGVGFRREELVSWIHENFFGHYRSATIRAAIKKLLVSGTFRTLDGKSTLNDQTVLITGNN